MEIDRELEADIKENQHRYLIIQSKVHSLFSALIIEYIQVCTHDASIMRSRKYKDGQQQYH